MVIGESGLRTGAARKDELLQLVLDWGNLPVVRLREFVKRISGIRAGSWSRGECTAHLLEHWEGWKEWQRLVYQVRDTERENWNLKEENAWLQEQFRVATTVTVNPRRNGANLPEKPLDDSPSDPSSH